MPQMRKLSPDEVLALEARDRRPRNVPHVPEELPLQEYGCVGIFTTSGEAGLSNHPRVGDVLCLRTADGEVAQVGITLAVRGDGSSSWLAAEVLINGGRYLVQAASVERVLGRPRGISRIDQPSHRTHGWFVRLYEGHTPRLSRFFSDRTYGGIGAALKEALAFHASEDAQRDEAALRRRSVKVS